MTTDGNVRITRALISVSDKEGIVPFVQKLHEFGVEVISTGGTARELAYSGVPVLEVSEFTGFPEMLDGRVKTLHPRIYGGILYIRGNPLHEETIAKHGIKPIDMIVVNLYPFEKTVTKKGCTFEEAVENIDIGGPSMVRGAAKNHASVAVVTNPGQYSRVLQEMNANNGCIGQATRSGFALEAFSVTSDYDRAIALYLSTHRHSS